ncbi:Fur family transcriptional regulator [Nitrosomonas sp.]|uniref:Fur family transcriptional regulator n=1 Tax=Nitrosomonas sp. TaxID=42353 RepID=UPI0025E1DE33|nr:transcriptional repressor [Nitrosomonas sp.]MDR4515648.1 transcriptional repressor [Nitrosomonas sp.]
MMPNTYQDTAEELIRKEGGRATGIRVKILALLLAQEQAVTHREIEARLIGQQPDRVTLYRVLQWLADKGLIHKITSDDRVWRFHVNHDAYLHQHAHFKCTRCAKVVCLDDLPTKRHLTLPAGYRFQSMELTVKGLCAQCV